MAIVESISFWFETMAVDACTPSKPAKPEAALSPVEPTFDDDFINVVAI